MARILILFCLLLIQFAILNSLKAQEISKTEKDPYSFGIIPVFSYDSDLGLKYGAVVNLFESKINTYPNFDQYLNLKISHTTHNTLNLQALFESIKLIPKATTFIEATYTNDQKLDFFGFNGIETVFNKDFTDPSHNYFINKQFYSLDRKLIRLRADIQKNISSKHFRLLTGLLYHRVTIMQKKTQVTSNNIKTSLYENYIDWGIVDKGDKKGGKSVSGTLGLIYDTRNDNCYCTKGHWIEGFVVYTPNKLNEKGFSKLILSYRTYKSTSNEKYTFSLRLSSQSRLSGNIPSYLLPFYFDSQINQDGLGGAYTLRGITRNRIVADGFALGNFETRIKLKKFRLLNLDFQISSTLFLDLAYITQRRQLDLTKVPQTIKDQFFSNSTQKLYTSLGPGINIIFKQNNIITVNYGFSTNSQLGNGGLYIGSRFLF